ncbi:hypothetical protein [Phenylobacterium sp.]|nr:hypothetical protein [Phenylobacterium sp.]
MARLVRATHEHGAGHDREASAAGRFVSTVFMGRPDKPGDDAV